LTELRVQENLRHDVSTALMSYTAYPITDQEPDHSDPGNGTLKVHVETLGLMVDEMAWEAQGETGSKLIKNIEQQSPNPSLRLFVRGRVKLRRNDTTVANRIYTYISAAHTFEVWANDNAEPFRSEIQAATQALAWEMVRNIFISNTSSE